MRFNTILGLMRSFSDDFLRQTNLLLGEPTQFDSSSGNALSSMVANLDGLSNHLNDMGGLPLEEKKERKKRSHDPNAPKRPLTPYFLYMQTARPIIAKDLGDEAPKGAVQEEGQRRWAAMSPNDKVVRLHASSFSHIGMLTLLAGLEQRLSVQPSPVQCSCALVQVRREPQCPRDV